jgi:hypothetical protein
VKDAEGQELRLQLNPIPEKDKPAQAPVQQ